MNKKRRNIRDSNEEIIKKIYKRSNPVRIKKDTYRPVRTGWLLVGFIFLFLVILLSFANTQILNAGKLKEIAVNQQLTKKSILAKRGNILDRNGEVLAQSIEVDTITANPKLLKNKNKSVAVFAAAALGDLFTYVVTAIQLALANPSATGGFTESLIKFLMVFAVTQIPLAIIEGLLTNIIVNILDKYEVMDNNEKVAEVTE